MYTSLDPRLAGCLYYSLSNVEARNSTNVLFLAMYKNLSTERRSHPIYPMPAAAPRPHGHRLAPHVQKAHADGVHAFWQWCRGASLLARSFVAVDGALHFLLAKFAERSSKLWSKQLVFVEHSLWYPSKVGFQSAFQLTESSHSSLASDAFGALGDLALL